MDSDYIAELKRCIEDPVYFAKKYILIKDSVTGESRHLNDVELERVRLLTKDKNEKKN